MARPKAKRRTRAIFYKFEDLKTGKAPIYGALVQTLDGKFLFRTSKMASLTAPTLGEWDGWMDPDFEGVDDPIVWEPARSVPPKVQAQIENAQMNGHWLATRFRRKGG